MQTQIHSSVSRQSAVWGESVVNSTNALEVVDVWKSFQSGSIRGRTFVQGIQSRIATVLGREDPNSLVVARDAMSASGISRNQRFWAVRGASFAVKQGEVVALLGRNGAGKSTLLQIICRITEADKGIVKIRGRIASLLGAGVGFNDEMTGRENVYLNGSILGMTPDQITQKMEAIAEFAEIPQFLETPVKRYSSGMRSRLGFSVAVHLDCDIMILDEVFAAGDKVFREKCVRKMYEIGKSGRTIIIVAHMPEMLENLCQRGLVLQDGKLIYDGGIDHAISLYMNETTR